MLSSSEPKPKPKPKQMRSFIGVGLDGLRKLREKNLNMLETPSGSQNGNTSVFKLLPDSPLINDFFYPKPPQGQPKQFKRIIWKNLDKKIDYSIKWIQPQTKPQQPQQPDYRKMMITAATTKGLKVSSVNCAYCISTVENKNIFNKVQISKQADPLINEVLITQLLTDTYGDKV